MNTHKPEVCIELTSMPQLVEVRITSASSGVVRLIDRIWAIRKEDDWTGTKDAAARRRAQTRLNMRAYRKRKALAKKADDKLVKQETTIDLWDIKQELMSSVASSNVQKVYNSKTPLLPYGTRINRAKFIFPLCPDHLITLLQYNALRALSVNRTLISGILYKPLECDQEIIHVVPDPSNPASVPAALLPTILQQTVPHGDWVDLFPSPEGRDNLIRALGTFDEDELWADCIGGLYEGYPDDEMERRGMIAWSPPWDISGWEMSEGFVEKWGWLFKGLPGPFEATNRWRIERGEEPLSHTS